MVVAPVVVGLLWRYMLTVNYEVVNYLLSLVGIPRIDFLGDPFWALPTLSLRIIPPIVIGRMMKLVRLAAGPRAEDC
jgi:ABC-type sugar transport system permease subunit